MNTTDPFDYQALRKHLAHQQKAAWDIDSCVDWNQGVDADKFLLPLDEQSVAFPHATLEQKIVLSQYMGLVVNSTISEMEDCLPKLKRFAWQSVLDSYPVGPEMIELGEMFFAEEAKHAAAFKKYYEVFCKSLGLEIQDVDQLLPKAFGSQFQKGIINNAIYGGHAFWWIVSNVEEVSIDIFKGIYRNRAHIDPLYFQLHRRHLEEESRHANYAYLMLNLINSQHDTVSRLWHRKTDFLYSQLLATPWVVTELGKFFEVKKFVGKHPWYDTLASCIPLYETLSLADKASALWKTAPYVSWILNPKQRAHQTQKIQELKTWSLPFPDAESSILDINAVANAQR